MKIQTKIILFLIASTIILLSLLLKKPNEIETIKTVVRYDTITRVIDNTKPTEIKEVIIKVPYKVKETEIIIDTIYKDIKTKKYIYKDTLQNGVLNSTIFADNIYRRDIELTTFNKETATTITKSIFKSSIYFGGHIVSSDLKSFNNVSINSYLVTKNHLYTIGIGNDFINNQVTYNFGVALKF